MTVEFRSEFLRSLRALKSEQPTGFASASPAAQAGADRLATVIGADRPTERE